MRSPPHSVGGGPTASRAHHTHRPTSQPRHGARRLRQPGLFQKRIVGPFAQVDDDLLGRDLDGARCVDELPIQLGRARPREALETFAQPAVQQVRQHRQGQVEIHVQANLATQAIEMKERDLFT